ncbi:hypothetical protein B0H14DRAFT_2594361 [Mycena olivaceomarginata]|nr:hypothetical protein B0H14DRAFT_2594361 [Mycena olivaceomarginata]
MDWRTYVATHRSSKTHERAVERDAVRKKQIADTQRTQEADLARQHAAELKFLGTSREAIGTDTRLALDMDGGPTAIDEADTDELLAEIMQNAGEQIELCTRNDPITKQKSAEWSPYPSKMLFLLDTLDNLPRLRISNSLRKVFLWILKESGAHDVPSFDHLRKDWANPETRKFIRVYPEIPEDGVIREIWHAQKWRKDMDLDNLSPMYAGQYCHFYVNELARLKTGEPAIPIRWVKFKNAVCADTFKVEINSEGLATVLDETTILISASELTSN